jgi:hypothetical protein
MIFRLLNEIVEHRSYAFHSYANWFELFILHEFKLHMYFKKKNSHVFLVYICRYHNEILA